MAQSSSATANSSNRRYLREHDANSPGSPRYANTDWESQEAMLHKELEEVKARAAQMEKTMRWWSDCTANWKEKWCEVRDERNKIKKEVKFLKSKLETVTKDMNTCKEESQELEEQNAQLKKEMEKIHLVLLKNPGQFDLQIRAILDLFSPLKSTLSIEKLQENNIEQSANKTPKSSKKEFRISKSPNKDISDSNSVDKNIEEYISQGAVPKHTIESHKEILPGSCDKQGSRLKVVNEEVLMQKISLLNSSLEEASKTINVEREEKSSLHRELVKLKSEIIQLQEKCKELQDGKAEVMKELLELKSHYQGELSIAQTDLVDETTREGVDRKLSELRTELEKLQLENAAEWGKRERLESEKISLERENKQLRSELREAHECLESRKSRPLSGCEVLDSKKLLQQEFLERNKEFAELKQSYAKLKKLFAEKTTELSHASRRSEQYETEVKRIRVRVEELKKELMVAQDEVDVANNSIRRLQRINEDLAEQLDITNSQLEHYRNSITESRAPDVVAEIMDEKTCNDDED